MAAVLLCWPNGVRGQEAVEDINRGLRDGMAAGRRSSVILPVSVAWGSATALAVTDSPDLNNNEVVSALVANTAISAGLTWLTSVVMPPRPNRNQRSTLQEQSPLYANSWRSGFRQTAAKRRFAANALGVLTGVGITYLIYSNRVE